MKTFEGTIPRDGARGTAERRVAAIDLHAGTRSSQHRWPSRVETRTRHLQGGDVRTTILSMAATAGLIIGAAAIVHAQQSSGPGSSIPSDGVSGPRAAGGASDHQMQQKRSEPGKPGASGFAPGRVGTTGSGYRDDRIGDDRDELMPDNRQDRLHDRDDRPTTGDLDDRR